MGSVNASAQKQPAISKEKQKLLTGLESRKGGYGAIARQIWDFAEVGYQEYKSSNLLQETLKKEGFEVTTGVAEIPTAFVASWGSGKPVISLLAEFDALPGINQDTLPVRHPIEGKEAGHACGHHLFGTASVAAGIALKDWLKETGRQGTIRVVGCPAEEGGSGKVYLVRAGIFADTDIAIHWHPSDRNSANPGQALANISGKIRFTGVSAHAAAAPERGRSALDGVESLNYMVNMMREHVPSDSRIHYVITRGGSAPNVVPDFAEVYYYARHKENAVVKNIWGRIIKAAEGAAMGTETKVAVEITGGTYNILPVISLAELMNKNLSLVGGYDFTAEEKAFAEKLSESFENHVFSADRPAKTEPFSPVPKPPGGSTDVGDVSWTVPTVGMNAATWVHGTAAHSWQAIAAGGTGIGEKGMMVAAKTMAATAMDLFNDATLVSKAKAEWQKSRGENFHYEALLGDRKPALDYRK
ncbi:MAG: amidohydrolase [Chitinophagaceae bacterium]|nr:amidohydrolase [Chitinophagaceae bacterium]MCW5929840.1 amidohydrolase [Chitinophagaceae bacterium]